MKKVDIKEKARKLNEFIQENKGKVLTRLELKEGLKCVTSGDGIFCELAKLFPSETLGRAKMYEMPKEPIHMSRIEQCWEKHRKDMREAAYKRHTPTLPSNEITDEQAIDKLKKSNNKYVIRKIVGYKTEELLQYLAENYPDIYRKFCKYEYV
jgi:hypothetical protein